MPPWACPAPLSPHPTRLPWLWALPLVVPITWRPCRLVRAPKLPQQRGTPACHPPAVHSAALPRDMPAAQVFVAAKQQLGEVLSAFEFLDRESLLITLRHLPGAKDPLPSCQARRTARRGPLSRAVAQPSRA